MARSDKIRKVNDDLYEQDFQADSGERSIFKWERQYEALHITLSNLQCIYGASVEIKEISLFGEGNDAINESPYILARGSIGDDWLNLIGNEKVSRRKSINRVELRAYSGDWDELLARARNQNAIGSSFRWFGSLEYLSEEDEEKGYVDKGDEFELSIIVPKPIFEKIFEQLRPYNSALYEIHVSARVGVFRSEVDRSLEEPGYPRDFWVEQKSPAYFSSMGIEYRPEVPSITDEEEEPEANTPPEKASALLNPAGKQKDAAAIWLRRLFFAVVVLTAIVLLKR